MAEVDTGLVSTVDVRWRHVMLSPQGSTPMHTWALLTPAGAAGAAGASSSKPAWAWANMQKTHVTLTSVSLSGVHALESESSLSLAFDVDTRDLL